MADAERIAVIVGVGQVNDRPADPAQGMEPVALMRAALDVTMELSISLASGLLSRRARSSSVAMSSIAAYILRRCRSLMEAQCIARASSFALIGRSPIA